jgi:hypothetical protein
MYMPAGDETPAAANSHEEAADAGVADVVLEHAAADAREATLDADVDGDAHDNEWLVISALRRVAPWTASEPTRDDAEPVLLIDEDLVPDTLVGLPAAIRAASS